MPQNSQNNPNFWTQKHQELCLKYRIKAAYQQFWCWLTNYAKPGKVIEVTLHEFNAWVEKQSGQPLSERHLKNLLKRLLEFGLVRLIKKYNWHELKLIIKPLEWLEPPRKRAEKRSEIRIDSSKISPQTQENSSLPHEEPSQQQQLNIKPNNHVSDETKNEIKQLAQKVDIHLPEKCEVYSYPIEKIFLALNLVFLRNKRDSIDNRIGLLIDCLRWEYWNEPENLRLLHKAGIITPESLYYDYYST
ncbi:hypothetical protein CDG76_20770 [Nostoc sp. 'Peltigera membranacea cyanobiont' 210A]|uniref:hypothetical protein n=1 Tax=Nostoc sp. 'Peltigera membranacea cyanobiont' 210A TaxID=2014529 RepID=UPI000B9587EC|nr:hypothetical protein [Nostoc sp. 'Peltigera membranacea cyanobiont' 210A]OYD93129.1 hypothetical protein CDG76_20770 [Nostoc sp. 'Peltigera membranacea cyanobiont' 210A]